MPPIPHDKQMFYHRSYKGKIQKIDKIRYMDKHLNWPNVWVSLKKQVKVSL